MNKGRLVTFLFVAGILMTWNACSNTVSSSEDLENFPMDGNGSTHSSADLSSSSVKVSSSSFTKDTLGFSWVEIPKMNFIRGVSDISVSAFEILETEVTQKLYAQYLELPNQKKEGDSLPVTKVSWYDAVRFCNAVAKAYSLDTSYVYSSVGTGGVLLDFEIREVDSTVRLPTETEWELAIRAGTSTKYYWDGSDQAHLYANYYSESGVLPVASFKPNGYGLYDMAGNVSEWVEDWYSAYSNEANLEDPRGPSKGSQRVFRGGSWSSSLTELASDNREKALPDESLYNRGFRIVRKK